MSVSKVKNCLRALRLAFVSITVFPFILGSLLDKSSFSGFGFVLGLTCAVFTHLGANLINDYSDSKTGADWQDRYFYKFFGGSKLIQEGVFSENFYRKAALACFAFALVCALALAIRSKSFSVLGYYLFISFLGFSYSFGPFRFSYHYLGELIIFLLFGPALVMGSFFIQTQTFPTLKGFVLSLPFGIFTAAILFANEVPDYYDDRSVKKFTLVNLFSPEKSYRFYYFLVISGFLSIILGVYLRYLRLTALFALIFAILGYKSGLILKKDFSHKPRLIISSQMTIAMHNLVSIALILSLLL